MVSILAEALGTAILVATVVGSGIMAERLADGNQAIALLGNTIPTGAILVVIITIFGPVSGAHFNPAVSLVFATRGEMPWKDVLPYIVAQCIGGLIGTVVAHSMFDLVPVVIGIKGRGWTLLINGGCRGASHRWSLVSHYMLATSCMETLVFLSAFNSRSSGQRPTRPHA